MSIVNVDPARPCIGISHHPDIMDLLDTRRLDLLVCGHTHGGQIRFPFFGAVVVPGTRPLKGSFAEQHGLSITTPLIVKYRDEKTDHATALERWLR